MQVVEAGAKAGDEGAEVDKVDGEGVLWGECFDVTYDEFDGREGDSYPERDFGPRFEF